MNFYTYSRSFWIVIYQAAQKTDQSESTLENLVGP